MPVYQLLVSPAIPGWADYAAGTAVRDFFEVPQAGKNFPSPSFTSVLTCTFSSFLSHSPLPGTKLGALCSLLSYLVVVAQHGPLYRQTRGTTPMASLLLLL